MLISGPDIQDILPKHAIKKSNCLCEIIIVQLNRINRAGQVGQVESWHSHKYGGKVVDSASVEISAGGYMGSASKVPFGTPLGSPSLFGRIWKLGVYPLHPPNGLVFIGYLNQVTINKCEDFQKIYSYSRWFSFPFIGPGPSNN